MKLTDVELSLLLPVLYFSLSTASFLVSIQLLARGRLISAPFIFGFAVLSLQTSPHLSWIYQGAASYWNLMIWVWMHHASTVLFIDRFKFPCAPMSREGWILAYKIWADPQHQLDWSTYMQRRNERLVDSRSYLSFALRRIAKIAICWYIELQIVNPAIASHFQFKAEDFAPKYELLLRRSYHDTPMTSRDFQIRSVISIYWIWLAYLLLDGANVLLSLFFVCIMRLVKPEEWSTLFGSVAHTGSLRGFWGKFWHRLAAPSSLSSGRLLTRSCLRYRSRSIEEIFFIAFWTFLVSAFVHAASEWQADEPVFPWRELQFWLTNFVAAALETFVIGTWKQISNDLGMSSSRVSKLFVKFIGHIWVFFFFFWAVPSWQYPKLFVALTSHEAPNIRDEPSAFLELLLST